MTPDIHKTVIVTGKINSAWIGSIDVSMKKAYTSRAAFAKTICEDRTG